MYRNTLMDRYGRLIIRTDSQTPLSEKSMEILRACGPEGSFVDVCRIEDNGLSDTANFRDIVEADLEPLEE